MAHARPQPETTEHAPKDWPSPEEVMDLLEARLALTQGQKTEILPIIVARQERMKALAADTSSGQLERARRARTILSDGDRAIEALLTDEQRQRYRTLREQMNEEARARIQRHRATQSLAPAAETRSSVPCVAV